MSGNPSDRSTFQIGVQKEHDGRGGSRLLHRIFNEGRKVFISKPINHFELDKNATRSFLMGGGIGITPMIAFAHTLHEKGRDFEMHYSASCREEAGFLADLASVPWADRVSLHMSDEGTRAKFDEILGDHEDGCHVYVCGPERHIDGVIDAAAKCGFPEESRHVEFFSVPEIPDYENHPFTIRLQRSGKDLLVPSDQSATDVLAANGIPVDVKCSDGLCGVCRCKLISGDVEHRDFVLSKKQRETTIILCQSRAAEPDGVIEIDL